ncbi:hypothetical protein [Megavirus chiliensis]|uniref:Uncharacterized protein n=2 Tax=Megamimivirinae TaxID=3044648 RepID=A0A2L2DNP9_MIMIV|nr:hypothetical protein MegaChil _gp0955 [Megavirus chiliensis]AEQ32895.1 hypothetical protein [Megavirus chiliensis]AVG47790.1 hypothetical protein [Acanthamoeba polyphaga mimivirus]
MSIPYYMLLSFERQPHTNKVHDRSRGPTQVISRVEKENSDEKTNYEPEKMIEHLKSIGCPVYLDNNNKIKIEF